MSRKPRQSPMQQLLLWGNDLQAVPTLNPALLVEQAFKGGESLGKSHVIFFSGMSIYFSTTTLWFNSTEITSTATPSQE